MMNLMVQADDQVEQLRRVEKPTHVKLFRNRQVEVV